jgi:XisI protein
MLLSDRLLESDDTLAVVQYRQHIQNLLMERAQRRSANSVNAEEQEMQAIFDVERDHYQLLHLGWRGNKREFGCILHLDIKDGKIWIQHDGTEVGIANQLVELGVPKRDIVLAFHEPSVRQYTEFGEAVLSAV